MRADMWSPVLFVSSCWELAMRALAAGGAATLDAVTAAVLRALGREATSGECRASAAHRPSRPRPPELPRTRGLLLSADWRGCSAHRRLGLLAGWQAAKSRTGLSSAVCHHVKR